VCRTPRYPAFPGRPNGLARAAALRGLRPAAVALLLCLGAGCASAHRDEIPPASPDPEPAPGEKKGWTKEQKLIAVNAATTLAIAAYGFQFWDYGGNGFQVVDEGWFGQDTSYGGADKLGHAYASYLSTLGLATLYENWGYERPKADLYGAISSMSAFTLIEVGDGFSKNGFSWEDIAADAAGVLYGYWRRRVPAVSRLVDFRVEYIPSETFANGDHSDIVTDYSGFKYVLALKLDGFEKLSRTPLGWLELQLGYYTRGFATGDSDYYDEKTRDLYVAVGINVPRLLSKLGLRGVGKIFEYYQAPYTYVPFDWTLPQ
jgi:hypothetical protein